MMVRPPIIAVCFALLLAGGVPGLPSRVAAQSDEMPLLTGELWQQMSPDSKVAFVWGMSHIVELERQIMEDAPFPDKKSFIPFLIQGLQGHTLQEVVVEVDEYYRANPDQLERPVVRTIFHAVVLPKM